MDFDQDTVRASGRPPQYALPATVPPLGPEDFPEAETAILSPARKDYPPDMIRGWGFSISADAAVRLVGEARKIGMAGVILVFLLIAASVAGTRWGDPYAELMIADRKVQIEKDRVLTQTLDRLSSNDADRQKIDKLMYELMVRIVDKLESR